VSEEERKRRFETRERNKSHHDGERLLSYAEAQANFDHMPEKKIFLKTNKTVEQLIEDILLRLK